MLLLLFCLTLPVTFGESNNSHLLVGDDPTTSPPLYPSCFMEGLTWSSEESIDIITSVETLYSCQKLCLESNGCDYFSWYSEKSVALKYLCFLFHNPTTQYPCTNCLSGPQSCTSTSTPTTATTTTIVICELPEPPQKGEWFCPPATDPLICYLECYPGYVPEGEVIISCIDGNWTSSSSCTQAIGLITGSDTSPHNTAEVYGEGVHKHLPNLPDNRRYHTLDYVDSTVLLCGGWSTQTSCITLTESQQWISHSTTTASRSFHSSVVMLNQLHLLGGLSSRTSTEFLDPAVGTTWSQGWDLIEETTEGCTTKMGPQTLITTGGLNFYSAISYNVSSGAATRLMDLISPRWYHGCAYVRDPLTKYTGVIVAGGFDGYDLSVSEIFNIKEGKWSKTGQLKTTKGRGVRLTVLGESILALGGYNSGTLSTVDRFNLTSMDWSATENMLEARRLHAVSGVPPTLVTIN